MTDKAEDVKALIAQIAEPRARTDIAEALAEAIDESEIDYTEMSRFVVAQAAEIKRLDDSTISLWSDYCDKKMEVERLHELETAARAEIERLREKVRLARMLSARLHLIHDDGRYVSVWTLSANAGRPYNGPTYEAELAALDAVLTPEERQP